MKTLAEIGTRIAAERSLKKMRQADLAASAGLSRLTLNRLEGGKAVDIRWSKLVRILNAVGLEAEIRPVSRVRPTLTTLLAEAQDD